MKIRMRIDILGTFHNLDQGVKVGDVIDIEDKHAVKYIGLGYAEQVGDHVAHDEPKVETAVAPEGETATLEVPALDDDEDDDSPKALDEPEPVKRPKPSPAKTAPVKRLPRTQLK